MGAVAGTLYGFPLRSLPLKVSQPTFLKFDPLLNLINEIKTISYIFSLYMINRVASDP